MPPDMNIEHTIYLLVKHYRQVGISTREMAIAASIIIWQHEHPQEHLYYGGLPATKNMECDPGTCAAYLRTYLEEKQFLIITPIESAEKPPHKTFKRGQAVPLRQYDYDFTPLITRITEVEHG